MENTSKTKNTKTKTANSKTKELSIVSLQNLHIPSSANEISSVMSAYYSGNPEDEKVRENIGKIADCMLEVEKTKTSKYLKVIPIIGNYLVKREKEIRKGLLLNSKDVVKNVSTALEKSNLKLKQDNIILENLVKKIDVTIQQKKDILAEYEKALKEYNKKKDSEKDENIIYGLNQIIMDTQQILLTEENSKTTIEALMLNNMQLSNNIKRTIDTTCQSLTSALLIETQLEEQKRLLSLTNTINKETSNLILSSSEKLKAQGASIQEQSMNQLLDQNALEQAMSNCLDALNQVKTFKEKAIPRMEEHINKTKELLSNIDDARLRIGFKDDVIEAEVEL